MNNVGGPLNESETAELEGILLGRDPDETWQLGMDEGVLTLPELDGFLTAIVSGPELIAPSQWLPSLWGDFPPSLHSPAEANQMLSLIFRHMNGIAAMLMEQPEAFEPIFFQHELAGEVVDIPDEWCEGFMRAVSLAPEAWEAGGSELDSLLNLIVDYTEAGNSRAQALPRVERDQLCAALPDAIRAIHAFWLARRAPLQPRRNQGPVAGRNDPCPCGSGRKFKKCCLQ